MRLGMVAGDLTPRQRFIAALERQPLTGRVPTLRIEK